MERITMGERVREKERGTEIKRKRNRDSERNR